MAEQPEKDGGRTAEGRARQERRTAVKDGIGTGERIRRKEKGSARENENSAKGGKKEPPPKKKLDERKDGPVRRSGGGGATGSGGGRRQAKEESSPAKRTSTSTGRLAKEKEVVVFTRKRGKDVEGDGSSQRDKKRPRQLRIDDD